MAFFWSVSYQGATISGAETETREAAERAATIEHDRMVLEGLDPDALAYHVDDIKNYS